MLELKSTISRFEKKIHLIDSADLVKQLGRNANLKINQSKFSKLFFKNKEKSQQSEGPCQVLLHLCNFSLQEERKEKRIQSIMAKSPQSWRKFLG